MESGLNIHSVARYPVRQRGAYLQTRHGAGNSESNMERKSMRTIDRASEIFQRIKTEHEEAIEEFIANRACEELYLDFKRAGNRGLGDAFTHADRENLARAIAGFGNTEGGVIVWGVDCSGANDVPEGLFPIQDPQTFRSSLEGSVGSCTIPPHPNVESCVVPHRGGPSGFVVTLIPRSAHLPHQVSLGSSGVKGTFYIRAGSSFVPAPYAVIAGMFGRGLAAELSHDLTVEEVGERAISSQGRKSVWMRVRFHLQITNLGPGIARGVYAYIDLRRFPPNCWADFCGPVDGWLATEPRSGSLLVRGNAEHWLPPSVSEYPIRFDFVLAPSFKDGIQLNGVYGAEGLPPQQFKYHLPSVDLDSYHKRYEHTLGRRHELPESEYNGMTADFNAMLIPQ